jgi:hypothetical protein
MIVVSLGNHHVASAWPNVDPEHQAACYQEENGQSIE